MKSLISRLLIVLLLIALLAGNQVIWADEGASLIAHYDFNNITNNTVSDKSGLYDAKLVGATVVDGLLDKAISINGAAGAAKGSENVSRLEVPDAVFSKVTDWSIAILVKSEGQNLNTAVITWGVYFNQDGPFINIWFNHESNQNAGIHVAIQPRNGTRLHGRAAADDYIKADSNYYWFIITQQGSVVKAYIDSKNVITMNNVNVTAADLLAGNENNIIAIGSSVIFPDPAPKCIIDDVRFYNGALSENQIEELVKLKNISDTEPGTKPTQEPNTNPTEKPSTQPPTTTPAPSGGSGDPGNGNVKTSDGNLYVLQIFAVVSLAIIAGLIFFKRNKPVTAR